MVSSFSKGLLVLASLSGSFNAVLAQDTTITSIEETTPTVTTIQTYPATALADKRFTYPSGIPYRVDTDDQLIRGSQLGYNICNSTTEGQQSLCQTAFANSIDDFCIWAPAEPNSTVADVEGHMVAWCTKAGRGTRQIPANTFTGLQFIKTPSYIAILGYIDQTKINMVKGDWGGEMDPHGADLRGNPIGGLLFSSAFSGNTDTYVQTVEWHTFIGNNFFCFKACDPADSNDAHYCEHVFDRLGCAYNIPNNAQNNTFESCEGENQDYPGTYTVDGVAHTFTQPDESLGAITTVPYTARVPATSNCVAHKSAELFANLPTIVTDASGASITGSVNGLSTSRGASGITTTGTA
ncbi:hypothetical protein M422DRAFT_171118, partial [Sphaerobolus stellatus SS14]